MEIKDLLQTTMLLTNIIKLFKDYVTLLELFPLNQLKTPVNFSGIGDLEFISTLVIVLICTEAMRASFRDTTNISQ